MTEQEIGNALRALTDGQLRRGMRAFAHPPRGQSIPAADEGDCAGCFCYEAFDCATQPARNVTGETYWRNGEWHREHLSNAYESYTALLYGECVRELAERGVALEPRCAGDVPCGPPTETP